MKVDRGGEGEGTGWRIEESRIGPSKGSYTGEC